MHNSYSRAFDAHTADLRITALNLWWLVTDLTGFLGPCAYCKQVGLGLLASLDLLLLAMAVRRRTWHLLIHAFCAAHLVGCFALLTGMHSRFLVYGLCSTCIWAAAAPRLRTPAVLLSVIQVLALCLNVLWNPHSRWGRGAIPPAVARWACDVSSVLVLLVLGYLVWQFGMAKGERPSLDSADADGLPGAEEARVLSGG